MVERQPAHRWGVAAQRVLLVSVMVGISTGLAAQYPTGPQVAKDGTAVIRQDYVSLPLSSRTAGSYPPPINFADQLGRVNFLRSEPANAPESTFRFSVNDLNRNLYILEKASRTFTPYINFEEVFPKFDNHPGYAGGFVTFAFDPDYAGNGKLYSVHTEDPNLAGSAVPTNANLPGLDLSGGYTITTPIDPSGVAYQFRLFRNDGSSKLATSNNFTVTSGSTTLSTSPLTVAAGNPVTSTWSGIIGAARDWIGVYLTTAPDTTFIDWRYVS